MAWKTPFTAVTIFPSFIINRLSLNFCIMIDTGSLSALKVSGSYDSFKELLRARLYECGWVDQLHMIARETKKNSTSSSYDGLYSDVLKKGRAQVPASVKRELLVHVKDKLLSASGYYDD